MHWLHERLAERGTFEETQQRFERLRGCALLPRGRANAGVRLSDKEIASAVLGFAHPLPGFAGHASVVLGDLRPMGGVENSFRDAPNLQSLIASIVQTGDPNREIRRLVLSVGRDFGDDEFSARIYVCDAGVSRTVSFVSKYAISLLGPVVQSTYDCERLSKLSAWERILGSEFFRDLSRAVFISRQQNRPLKTDWREYETEQERDDLHQKLGARRSSNFLNLRVDAHVTWPKEPTRIQFGGHSLVLFPKTKDHSHSISMDLANERISYEDARTLMNRLLSIMSWCDDRASSLHEGFSGPSVPGPILKQDLTFMTMHEWHFYRSLPTDDRLLRCLAFYRDGLNAKSVGLASHTFLSFYKVFETNYPTKKQATNWIDSMRPAFESLLDESWWKEFEADRSRSGATFGNYVYENCRVATAHAARDQPSDPDRAQETRRLLNASVVAQELARTFISDEFKFSKSYFSDQVR